MAEWSIGWPSETALCRDGVFVGATQEPEVAAEIVETMNRVGRLLDEVRREPVGDCGDGCTRHPTCRPKTPRERSHVRPPRDHIAGVTGCDCSMCRDMRDAERRSEATPQNDLHDAAQVEPVSWDEFDAMVDRTRAKATRWALCPRCCNRQALDRYGRITVHARAVTAAEREVCPGTGEMTL